MKCPTCPEVSLVMADRQGVEIDYCPQCRGVWLDRGELDKLLDRASARVRDRPPVERANRGGSYSDDGGDERLRGGARGKSWLSEIFD